MKKTLTLLLLMFPLLCFTQSDIEGHWKLSPVKLLRLNVDQSFHLTKGAFHHYGTYTVLTSDNSSILKLKFETVTINYKIISITADNLELIDTRNNEIIKARRAKQFTKSKPDVVETDYESTQVTQNEQPDYKNHYTNQFPDNQFYFALIGSGGPSWASGPSVESQTIDQGNLVENFSTSHIYNYGAGFKLGYQMTHGFYFGTGGSYNLSGFIAHRDASTSDPEYRFDAESSQSAKYSYNSIEVPLWVSYRVTDKWMVEVGALGSLPIRSSSKAIFTGENTVIINGEIDPRTSYESNEYIQNYPNLLEKYAVGGYAEIQRRLAKHLIFSVSYKYTKDYMQFDNSPITNNTAQANLILQLF